MRAVRTTAPAPARSRRATDPPAIGAPIDTWFASARRREAGLLPARPKELHESPPSSERFFRCQPAQPGSAPAHPILTDGCGWAKDFLPRAMDRRGVGMGSALCPRRCAIGVGIRGGLAICGRREETRGRRMKILRKLAPALIFVWLLSEAWLAGAGPNYPLKRSANGRYLVDQTNAPVLLMGDSPQALMVNLSEEEADRKSTRLNSSHSQISYAV